MSLDNCTKLNKNWLIKLVVGLCVLHALQFSSLTIFHFVGCTKSSPIRARLANPDLEQIIDLG